VIRRDRLEPGIALSVPARAGLPAGTQARLPAIAPDRRSVVAVLTTPDGREVPWVYTAAGTPIRPLLGEDPPCTTPGRPAWSEDGARIAFICDRRSGQGTLWLGVPRLDERGVTVGVDRIEQARLGGLPITGAPTWSGAELVIVRSEIGAQSSIRIATVTEGAVTLVERPLVTARGVEHRSIDAFGDRLLFLTGTPGGDRTATVVRVTGRADPVPLVSGSLEDAAWSPDGERILFQDARRVFTTDEAGRQRVDLGRRTASTVGVAWGSR
jgi:Tol biopolymer transport system component